MMSNNPNVSVIIPMRNAEHYIRNTLNTILSENSVSLELIIVDDLSTDCSVRIVESFHDSRIKILTGTGEGISAALNLAIEEASGEVIMRCDADDYYPPDRIRRQYAWMSNNIDYGALCGGFSTMDGNANFIAKMETGDISEDITTELTSSITRTHFCTFAIRANVLRKLGGFRKFFETAEDIDLQLRLSSVTKVMYAPDINYMYRLHNQSITHTQGNVRRNFFEDTARYFQHQRNALGVDDLDKGKPPIAPSIHDDKSNSVEEQIQGILIGRAWDLHAKGFRLRSLMLAWQAFIHNPLTFRHYRSVIALILKPLKIIK